MYTVFGFYKFKEINLLKKKKRLLLKKILYHKIRGTIILSKEGINGTISGLKKDIYSIIIFLKKELKFKNFNSTNTSNSSFQPFHKGKVKIKKEVVPIGIKVNSKNIKRNKYLSGKNWNKLISKQSTVLLDARKPFEYEVGTFKNAINPSVKHFRDFPKYLKRINKTKSIAMFCTGGIRCEKASIYLYKKGFKNVYQLKGGVLNYLKNIKKNESLWKGECYVFDNRISVKHKLKIGNYSMCSGCRTPVSTKEKKSNKYELGVSCPKCYETLSENQKSRFRMRQNQIDYAKKIGQRYKFQKEF